MFARFSLLMGMAVLLIWPALAGVEEDYAAVKRKFDAIEQDRLPAGSRVVVTPRELNAYAIKEVSIAAPQGVRSPNLELDDSRATGFAYIDFVRLQQGRGEPPNWLLARLLTGERPVRVTVRMQSGGGKATIFVERVEVSGLAMQGAMLDFLIENYLLPRYPEAKIGKPFELGHRIDRIEVTHTAVTVSIGR